jgi:hypothetical protein
MPEIIGAVRKRPRLRRSHGCIPIGENNLEEPFASTIGRFEGMVFDSEEVDEVISTAGFGGS